MTLGSVVIEITDYSLSCDLSRSRDQMFIWRYLQEPIKEGYPDIEDIVVLVCQVILQDYVIKG